MAEGFNPFTTQTITFEGKRYPGAKVVLNLDVSVEESAEISEKMWSEGATTISQAELFAKYLLVSWNLVDKKKQPIPPTPAGVMKAPAALVRACIATWSGKTWDIDAPLDGEQSDG